MRDGGLRLLLLVCFLPAVLLQAGCRPLCRRLPRAQIQQGFVEYLDTEEEVRFCVLLLGSV
jgi:hypothetical protein